MVANDMVAVVHACCNILDLVFRLCFCVLQICLSSITTATDVAVFMFLVSLLEFMFIVLFKNGTM